jgi:YD repeat-containing protein
MSRSPPLLVTRRGVRWHDAVSNWVLGHRRAFTEAMDAADAAIARAERGMTPATTPRPTPNSAAGVTPGRSTCPGLRPSEETFPSHRATSRRAELGVDRQLRQVTYPDGQTEAFTYGAAGNRLSRRAGGTTTSAPTTRPAGQRRHQHLRDGSAAGPSAAAAKVTECPGTDGETRRSLHPPPDADAREPSVRPLRRHAGRVVRCSPYHASDRCSTSASVDPSS